MKLNLEITGYDSAKTAIALLEQYLVLVDPRRPGDADMPSPDIAIELQELFDFGLNVRSYNALMAAGFDNVQSVENAHDGQLRSLPNFGASSLESTRAAIAAYRGRRKKGGKA